MDTASFLSNLIMGCTGNCKASQLMLFFIVIHRSGLWHLPPSRAPWFTQWGFWFSSLERRSPSGLWYRWGAAEKTGGRSGCDPADGLHLKDILVSMRAERLPVGRALCAVHMMIVNAHFTDWWILTGQGTQGRDIPVLTFLCYDGSIWGLWKPLSWLNEKNLLIQVLCNSLLPV